METSIGSATSFKLAGISAILAGVLIVSFALISDMHHLLFFPEIYKGGSVLPWIQSVFNSPGLAKIVVALPILGFSCFLLVASILYRHVESARNERNISLVSIAIGVPVVVAMWVMHLCLMNHVLLNHGVSPEIDIHIESTTSFMLLFFHVMNDFIGPLFIIVFGTPLMAWAAYKSGILPGWMAYWAIGCGVLLAISFMAPFVPALAILSLGAPLHMVWYIVLGILLMKKSGATATVR